MSNEEWRPVPDWEDMYEVSDSGQVRSKDRLVRLRPGVEVHREGRTLRPIRNLSGHLQVALHRKGVRRQMFIHRLVLAAFAGPCPDGMEGCHGNGEPGDNRLSNLRWDTRGANMRDAVRHGRHNAARRTHCPQGHPYSTENTLLWDGRRHCKACRARVMARSANNPIDFEETR